MPFNKFSSPEKREDLINLQVQEDTNYKQLNSNNDKNLAKGRSSRNSKTPEMAIIRSKTFRKEDKSARNAHESAH